MSRPFARLVAVAGIGCLALSACAPGSNTAGAPPENTQTGTVGRDPASLGDVTLTVWDQEVRGGQAAQITKLNDAFQKKYPNIKLQRVSRSFDDLNKTIKLALSGDNPPDVFQTNNGRADMGTFVKGRLILPLDRYAQAYGWDQRYPESVRQYSSYSPDGATFGRGSLYGLPQVGEVVGVYVNKKHLQEAGLSTPKTWEEFEAGLATLKSKRPNEAPLVLGNLDKWPAVHVFGPVQAQHVAPDTIRRLGFGQRGGSWQTPENTAAAQNLVEWVDKGYIDAKANGLGYDPAWQSFGKGTGTYLMAGTWLAPDLSTAMKDDVTFILPPPSAAAGGKVVSTGGTGIPWAISAKSKNPDAAAAYIDFITNSEAMKVLAETGNLPVVETASQKAPDALTQDVFTAFGTVVDENGLVPYLDYATPTMGDTLGAALQDLIAGRENPAQFLETVQKDYGVYTEKHG